MLAMENQVAPRIMVERIDYVLGPYFRRMERDFLLVGYYL